MGGFLYNGCGARDYFTKIKYLGEQMCPNCNTIAPFYLEKGDYKVAVLWIPTVTLKQRYALMCQKCQEGPFVEEAEANKIMNGSMSFSDFMERIVEAESGSQCPKCGGDMEDGFCSECGASSAEAVEAYKGALPAARICPECGNEVDGAFCGKCGTKYVEPVITQRRICASCGAEVNEAFCGKCGAKYVEPVIVEPEQVKICGACGAKVEHAFCGKCGTKYEPPVIEELVTTVDPPTPPRLCASCGAEVDGAFCGKCGAKYQENTETAESPKQSPDDHAVAKEWECSLCGTKNAPDQSKCLLCGCEK